ncbi:hypothetical protein ACFO4O_07535 [Glaciecola siphonariae]|uniref:Uncharacterized protein n=1 Tax=Glaciecola siphonariae TaxID=521012 RepID=A0ABV9LWI8_9ALTE
MSLFLMKEQTDLLSLVDKHKVLENLNDSKKQRAKARVKKLLLSKRGLGLAFAMGISKELLKHDDAGQSPSSKSKNSARLARAGLSAWLSGT